MKKAKTTLWMLLAMMMAFGMAACGGGDDDTDDPKPVTPGGEITDPTIPVLSDVKYELAPTAVIVPASTTKQITSVDLTGHKFTLPATATKPEVGQTLIFNTPTKLLPDGLLAKVTAVSETSSGYVVNYQDADLKDAFKTLEIPEQYIPLGQYVEHIYDANGKELSFSRAGMLERPQEARTEDGKWDPERFTRASGNETLKIPLPETAWKIASGLELTPKMTVDLAMRFVLMYGDYQIDYANVKVDAGITVGADLNFELKGSSVVDYRKPILTVVCGGIPVGPVVITPGIEVAAIFKVDGKLSLEASISYTRTVHASLFYQKGHDLKVDCKLDPEADDALKFNFGPKYEGAVSYGLSAGPFVGLYGKTFALNLVLDSYMKESISAKFSLLDVSTKSSLIPFAGMNFQQMQATLTGSQWNFAQWEGFSLNQAFCIQPNAELTVLNKGTGDLELSEIAFPIDSRPILPQVNLNKDNFLTLKNGDAKLLLHMPGKSVLDYDADFYAEWTDVATKKVISSKFNFNDDKRDMLADDKEVDIEAESRLEEGHSYTLAITEVLTTFGDLKFSIFEGSLKVAGASSVSPEAAHFKWNDDEVKKIKVDKGNYPYYGVDTDSKYSDWITAVTEKSADGDGTVLLSVDHNLTFEPREGEIKCWVSDKKDPYNSEKKFMTVKVTQDAVSGVDWTPKELTFNAEGGSQEISFTFGSFDRYGAEVASEGHGWCSVKAQSGKIIITVSANSTTEPRECIVNCLVMRKDKPENYKVYMPVKVRQEAGTGEVFDYHVGKWHYHYSSGEDMYLTLGRDGTYELDGYDRRKGTYKVVKYEFKVRPEDLAGVADDKLIGIVWIEQTYTNLDTGETRTKTDDLMISGNRKTLVYEWRKFTRVQ